MENKDIVREMKFRNRKSDKIFGILNIVVSITLIMFVSKVIMTGVDNVNIFFVVLDILGAILFIIIGIVNINRKNMIYIKLFKDKISFNNGIIGKYDLDFNQVIKVEKVMIDEKLKLIKLHADKKQEFSFSLSQLEPNDEKFFCDFVNEKFKNITTTRITKGKHKAKNN